jgi:hypothetical protein
LAVGLEYRVVHLEEEVEDFPELELEQGLVQGLEQLLAQHHRYIKVLYCAIVNFLIDQ